MARPKVPDDLKVTDHITLGFTRAMMVKIRLRAAEDNLDAREWCIQKIWEAAELFEDTDRHALPVLPEDEGS